MDATERFTGRASDYVGGRPSYPPGVIDALFNGLRDPRSLIAVDLGAGTGISSRFLAASCAKVIAIEPNAEMREHAAQVANVEWVAGTAEATTLEPGISDLVVAFQAFHWFKHEAALREMKRIVRPGGRAALVYNERDDADLFTAEYSKIARKFATDQTEQRRDNGRGVFEAYPGWRTITVVNLPNAQTLGRDRLHARANSTSYFPKSGPNARELHASIDRIFDEYQRNEEVTMHMKTIVLIGDF